MSDPELKKEFLNIRKEFKSVRTEMAEGFKKVNDSIESLARAIAKGFDEVDLHFERLDSKLQNQIDALMANKADRSELASLRAQIRNLRTN